MYAILGISWLSVQFHTLLFLESLANIFEGCALFLESSEEYLGKNSQFAWLPQPFVEKQIQGTTLLTAAKNLHVTFLIVSTQESQPLQFKLLTTNVIKNAPKFIKKTIWHKIVQNTGYSVEFNPKLVNIRWSLVKWH